MNNRIKTIENNRGNKKGKNRQRGRRNKIREEKKKENKCQWKSMNKKDRFNDGMRIEKRKDN